MMILGDTMRTPRFCNVKISAMFDNEELARVCGFTEPTHYKYSDYGCDTGFDILGKSVGDNRMVFAAVRLEEVRQ